MSKVRVYELARETGLPNREVIRRLGELDIEVRSHSSTVEEADAARFRDSLGKRREERRRAEEERQRREAEEYDLAANATPPVEAKARRILPPHLRERDESSDAEEPAAPRRFRPAAGAPFRPDDGGGVSVGGATETAGSPEPEAPEEPVEPVADEQPAPAHVPDAVQPAASPLEPVADAGEPVQEPPPMAEQTAKPDVAQPAAEPVDEPVARDADDEARGVPGVPRPGTPPRPGQPIRPYRSPQASGAGAPPEQRRRVDPGLPREGSGKRAIPPPVKPAPERRSGAPGGQQPGGKRGGAGDGRGQPARPGGGQPARPGGGQPARPGGGPPARPGGPGPAGRGKKRGKKRKDLTPQEQFEEEARPRRKQSGPVKATVQGPVQVVPGVTVGEFAKLVGVNATDIVRVLFGMGEMITVTQSMSEDLVEIVAAEMEVEVDFVTPEELEFGVDEDDAEGEMLPRAPVVTVMGHVDHGKTLLLDAIREADVVSGEAGGITQHIGAYQVRKDGRAITFIDTPGHEAFTQMRARGARVTDVAILVVAADDGVKPQTVEAINHIKAAEVPIIVAVNKMDLETADPTRVRTQLTEYSLVAEEFGGQTTMVNVSAKSRENIDELLEMVLLQADIAELGANPDRAARGAVIEANLDKGRGAVATVLVQAGTLRVGDSLVAGIADCRVRAMFDEEGKQVSEAGPSTPVQVLGWNAVPDAGDEFRVVDDERTARDIAENRQARQRRMELAEHRPAMSLEDLSGAIAEGELQTLNLIVKGDVAGSVEVVADAMDKLELPGEVNVRIVHQGVGAVTENDVSLAEASNAIIIAFNVRPDANARRAIEESGVDLRQYSVIYKATEDIQKAVAGLLSPEFEEVVVGRATVREVFKIPRGFVFGCYVTEGRISRNAGLRVVRDGVVVAEDTIASLKRFKEDATEVTTGYECGVGLEKFQDIKVGDEFEVYRQREVARA